MRGFTKFDPRAFLESERHRCESTLAELATLAGVGASSRNLADTKTTDLENSPRQAAPAKVAKVAKVGAAPHQASIEHGIHEARDDFEERAGIVEFEAGIPTTWAEGFARLDPNHAPTGVPLKRWRQFVGDVGLFLECWAGKAAALGWGPEDLFGAHPRKPFERIDYLGLLWLLNGARVIALTEDTAAVEMANGARQSYRRKPYFAGRVIAWELGQ
jgi:hypothetical protein